MARKVRQIQRKGKHVGLTAVRAVAAPDARVVRIAMIQALVPIALEKVCDELQEDLKELAGERYVRTGRRSGHVRWTPQRGSVYLGDQKLPITVPRVRNRLENREVPLPTYQAVRRGGAGGVRAECVDDVTPVHSCERAQTPRAQ